MPVVCKNGKRLRVFKLKPKLKTKDTYLQEGFLSGVIKGSWVHTWVEEG